MLGIAHDKDAGAPGSRRCTAPQNQRTTAGRPCGHDLECSKCVFRQRL